MAKFEVQRKPNPLNTCFDGLRVAYLVFAAFFATFWPHACHAAPGLQGHVLSRAWAEDPSGQLSFEQARQLPVTQVDGMLSAGFGRSVIWMRLRIDPDLQTVSKLSPDRLVLRIRPVYLDDIEVFDAALADPKVGSVGDRLHPRKAELDSLDFSITIDRGQAPRDIWLRLKSTSTRQIHADVLSFDEWEHASRMQQLVFSVYIALIVIFAVWGLTAWAFGRELLLGAFGLKQTMALGFALTSLGYLRVFWPLAWPADWLNLMASVFSIVSVSTAALFHIVFTREFGLRAWARVAHAFILSLQVLKLALLAAGHTILALQINMTEVLLVPVVLLATVVTANGWSRADPLRPILPRQLVVGFYVLFVIAMMIPALPGLALLAGGEISLYFVQTHGLMTGGLILIMLQYRARLRGRQQRETDRALERSVMQALQDREVREEQERLLEMLTHELKTPLATMNMRLDANTPGGRDIKRAIRDMSEVINRCVQASQLEDKRLAPVVRWCAVADVVRDAAASCPKPELVKLTVDGQALMNTDPQLLFIVISNLLENACKYAKDTAPIELVLRQSPAAGEAGASVLLSLSNLPGQAGWPDADRLFEKYYRSPQARRHSGTGLGLYLVRHLVRLLGGDIAYEPDASHVRFVIKLPSHPVAEQGVRAHHRQAA